MVNKFLFVAFDSWLIVLKYVTFRNEELEEKAKVMIEEDTEILDN